MRAVGLEPEEKLHMSRVHIKKRPLKIAYLINPVDSDWQEKIDAVWDFNQFKWGGRFNPIISTDGEALDDFWWTLLREFDPDYLYSFSTLSPTLIAELTKRLRPCEIEVHRTREEGLNITVDSYHEGVHILPSTSNLTRFQNVVSNDVLFAVRGLPATVSLDVYRFLLQNLGIIPDTYPFDRILQKVDKKVELKPSHRNDLLQSFKTSMIAGVDFVYPIQFSTLGRPTIHLEFDNAHSYDSFGIVVGDSFYDQVFYRNKCFFERDFSHRRINHIRLPSFFAADDELMEAMGYWLRNRSSKIHLFSFSFEFAELEATGGKLDLNGNGRRFLTTLNKSFSAFSHFPLPKYMKRDEYSFFQGFGRRISIPKGCDARVLTGDHRGVLEIEGPQNEGASERGSWVAEFYIEAKKERFFQASRFHKGSEPFLWRLPRKNFLAQDLLGGAARIDANGIPTATMSGKKGSLTLQLPDDITLIRSCLVGDWKRRMQGIVPRRPEEVDHAQPSNIGKYLAGFIEVFGGLDLAHSYFEDRFWRKVFDRISDRETAKESKLLKRVGDKLRKKINAGSKETERDINFESLAAFVIQLAKEVALDGKEIDFKSLLEEKMQEHQELMEQLNETWTFNENALSEQLSQLLELGVLIMGVSQKCPRCGSKCWYSMDDLSQSLVCPGCRQAFSLMANPAILYRLSTLARHGVFTHGLVPVTIVLGQIFKAAQSSFFFGPCMDLYKVTSSANEEQVKYGRITDADICCIQDGKFVIGEIKRNQDQFTKSQMMELADIADMVEADVLLFSSLDQKTTEKTNKLIEMVKERLKETNVEVGWYSIDKMAFEPSRGDC